MSCASSNPVVTDNLIVGNTGAGIACFGASPTITNNTIVANTTNVYGSGGIYMLCESSPAISNNIVAFNSAGMLGECYPVDPESPPPPLPTPKLRSNCVYGNTSYDYSGVTAGPGDISVDPLFVNRVGGDYHLSLLSPCINSGLNHYVSSTWLDMDREPRVLPIGGTVDIGADEYGLHTVYSPDEAKELLSDGSEVYLSANGPMIVTARFGGMPAYYVEQSNKASGMQCRGLALLDPGQSGIMHGTMDTIDGERTLVDASVVTGSLSTSPIPDPLSMPNRSVGGGSLGLQQGIVGAADLNNIGLRVWSTGKVTHTDSGFFYIDDGSGMDDGSGHLGVRVTTEGLSMPAFESYVKVTGASSCYKRDGDLFRLIRATEITPVP